MLLATIICIGAVLCILAIVKFGALAGETDQQRLVCYLDEQGSELLRMDPVYVPGFLSSPHKVGRLGGYVYSISYADADDRCHFAECETSAAIGVHLRRDGVRELEKDIKDFNDEKDK